MWYLLLISDFWSCFYMSYFFKFFIYKYLYSSCIYVQVNQQQETLQIGDGSPMIELASKVFRMLFIEVLKKDTTLNKIYEQINGKCLKYNVIIDDLWWWIFPVDQMSDSATSVPLPAKTNVKRYMMCEEGERIQLGELCPNTSNHHVELGEQVNYPNSEC